MTIARFFLDGRYIYPLKTELKRLKNQMDDLTDSKTIQVFGWDTIGNEIRVETHRFEDRKTAEAYLRTLGTENRLIAEGTKNIQRAWLIIGAQME